MSSIFIKIFSYDICHEFTNFLDQFDFCSAIKVPLAGYVHPFHIFELRTVGEGNCPGPVMGLSGERKPRKSQGYPATGKKDPGISLISLVH
jgi:hypothetical protein